ncbi:hypothetical protein VB737_08145 [Synechococcus sp. BA-120 BA3]|nr:hypothetical protein [Synechococcus sp. BA-120 BA3]
MAWLKPAAASLVLLALLPQAARAERWSFQRLVEAFEQRGFTVLGGHPRCAERGLYGLYLRESRRIVVCPRGNLNDTLLHEGWHAVQSRCLRGAPLLGEDALRQGLSRHDQRDLVRLYGADRWQREAEARVMARRDPVAYFRLVDELCPPPVAPASPPAPVPPEPGPQGQGRKLTGA